MGQVVSGHFNFVGWGSRYTLWALITQAPLTPALITPVSNCVEYKKVYIFAFNGNIRQKISLKERVHAKDAIYQISKKDNLSKTWYPLLKTALITLAPLTPAFINATRKNNADLGPVL